MGPRVIKKFYDGGRITNTSDYDWYHILCKIGNYKAIEEKKEMLNLLFYIQSRCM